jgi:hypothetical protein
MKEAEDQAKATIATMAGIAKIGAEIEAEPPPAGPQPFTGAGVAYVGPLTEQAPTKETANNYRAVAEQLKNIAAGSGAVISELTSAATLTKAFVVELKDAGISVNDVMADTKKLGEESYKASLQAAKIYEKMSPLERLDFEKVLASLGFPPETIASIEKGTAALKQARAEAEASSWENWAPAFRKIGDAIQSAAQAAGAFFSEFGRAAGAFLADFGQRLVDAVNLSVQQVKDAFNGVVSAISNAFNAILSPIQTVLTTIGGWINALLGKAQALVSVIGGLMGGGGSSGGGDGGSGYATGGVVSGAPGVDRNLAYLSAGEFVMRVAAVQKFGLPFMHSINALAAPRFAGGGLNAGGGLSAALAGSSGRPIHLHIDGRSFGPLTAPEGVASALERFSVHAQLSSAGRKQSWRK